MTAKKKKTSKPKSKSKTNGKTKRPNPQPSAKPTKLRLAIAESGLKQNWIANKAGICPTILSQYVTGRRKPGAVAVRAIAKAMRVKQTEIV